MVIGGSIIDTSYSVIEDGLEVSTRQSLFFIISRTLARLLLVVEQRAYFCDEELKLKEQNHGFFK